MPRSTTIPLAIIAALGCAESPVARTEPLLRDSDDRLEVFELSNAELATVLRASVAAIVRVDRLDMSNPVDVRMADDVGTLGELVDGCEDLRFAEQPSLAYCTATLIDDDLVMTAGACMRSAAQCRRAAFVFDLFYASDGALEPIAANDVYRCRNVLVSVNEALSSDDPYYDHAIVQLDRPVDAERAPMIVRAEHPLAPALLRSGDVVRVAGFSNGTPMKVETGASIALPTVVGPFGSIYGDGFVVSADLTTAGYAGAPFLNDALEMVGYVISYPLRAAPAGDFTASGDCTVETVASTGTPFHEGQYPHYGVNDLCSTGWPSEVLCGRAASCGDGYCSGRETTSECSADCAECGDGECTASESALACPTDCAPEASCGDGACNGAESAESCPGDCAARACGDGICDEGESCPIDCGESGAPASWRCDRTWFGDGELCDCECGGIDPDCDAARPVTRCAGGQVCSAGWCASDAPTVVADAGSEPSPDPVSSEGCGVASHAREITPLSLALIVAYAMRARRRRLSGGKTGGASSAWSPALLE